MPLRGGGTVRGEAGRLTNRANIRPIAAHQRPSRQQTLEAVETLIRWAGDDPAREGLFRSNASTRREFLALTGHPTQGSGAH